MGADEPLELLQVAELLDQEVLGGRVDPARLGDGLADVLDHAGVDDVEGAEVGDGVAAADAVVLPGAGGDQRAGRALGDAAEGRDPLGHVVGHLADPVDLRVQHLVDGDEVRADHVPVDVLQRQVEVVEGVEPQAQEVDELAALLDREAGDGVAGVVSVAMGCRPSCGAAVSW